VEALARPLIAQGIEELFFAAPLAKKTERAAAKKALAERVKASLKEQGVADEHLSFGIAMIGDELEATISEQILTHGRRVDGRGIEDIRPLFAEVNLLPRTHGSGHFLRGETQVLSTVTLAGPSAEQIIDTMEFDKKKRYMHHYSFPPYSVGEAKPMRGPGRREIGHGALAEKALEPVIPDKEAFPYVIRVVSETLTSNGSSSMASACGSTLALLDAGVPLKAPVAGIAIGLASTPSMDKWRIFTDLQDVEDGAGGMDFKVTGTSEGVTAIQLDTKSLGLTMEMVAEALRQAKKARLQVLEVLHRAIPTHRTELSKHAPRIESFMIHPDKIREVIGPGGKMINEIIDKTGVEIDIEDSGLVTVTSKNVDGIAKAVEWIRSLTQEAEVGKTYKGKVVRLMEFGAFVEILPKKDGLVHVSELAPWRVGKVEDIVKLGQEVFVKLVEIDSMGRLNLSMKQAEGNVYPERPAGGSEGHGGGHGGRPTGGYSRPSSPRGGSPRPPHSHGTRPQGFKATDLP
jgi:polyribonucleotide nucleotidyltransferase